MSAILVDTTPLVALCDPRDRLHAVATRDLDRLGRRPLVVCTSVLVEACLVLEHAVQRARLDKLLVVLGVRAFADRDEAGLWRDVFAWLARYAEHDPDWTDGYLAVLSGRDRRAKVWTYDREFETTWRRPDGSRVPLVGTRPTA